jgi:hypothetical protein
MTAQAAVFAPAPLNPVWPGLSRWVVLALVLAAHALLLWLGARAGAPAPRWSPPPGAAAGARMQLLWVAAPPVQEDASRRPAADPPSHPAPVSRAVAAPKDGAPALPPPAGPAKHPPSMAAVPLQEGGPQRRPNAQAATLPGGPAAAMAAEEEAAAAGTGGGASPPLDLRLPSAGMGPAAAMAPQSVRSQALNDPRSNLRAPLLEERIANATTRNDKLQEEDRGEGRKRVRQNGRCVDVYQARIAQIDAMNEVSRRAMSAVKPCE